MDINHTLVLCCWDSFKFHAVVRWWQKRFGLLQASSFASLPLSSLPRIFTACPAACSSDVYLHCITCLMRKHISHTWSTLHSPAYIYSFLLILFSPPPPSSFILTWCCHAMHVQILLFYISQLMKKKYYSFGIAWNLFKQRHISNKQNVCKRKTLKIIIKTKNYTYTHTQAVTTNKL